MIHFPVTQLFGNALRAMFAYCLIAFVGCGTVQEGTSENDWMSGPPVSMTARLEYRVDSLINENRRLSQQLEAVQQENRNLNMRLTEMQSKEAAPPVPRSVTPAPPAAIKNKAATSAAYETALGKFRGRDYQEAIDEFNELLNAGVSEDLVDNCHFWIGESYFAMKNYKNALASYQRVTSMTGAEKGDDAQLMIGNAYVAMGDKVQAKKAFQKLITLYPNSPLTKRAQTRINGL